MKGKVLLALAVLLMITAIPINSSGLSKKDVNLSSTLLFPNQTLTITANFKPNESFIMNPVGNIYLLNFTESDGVYVSEFSLSKDIVLGNYTLIVDGIVKHFVVDYYSINASFNGSAVVGEVKYYFVPPDFVDYSINGVEGKAEVKDGKFVIPIPFGSYTVKIRCGNAEEVLEVESVKKEILCRDYYFVNETVEVRFNFKLKDVYVFTPSNETIRLKVEEVDGKYFSSFKVDNVGRYVIFADELNKTILVDSYRIDAKLGDGKVRGNVHWNFIEPKYINYTIIPTNERGSVKLKDGMFEIEIPENVTSLILECGDASLTLNVTKSLTIEVLEERIGFIKFRALFNGKPVKANVFAKLNGKQLKVIYENETFSVNYTPENGLLELTAEYQGVKANLTRELKLDINTNIRVENETVFVNGNVTFNGEVIDAEVIASLGGETKRAIGEFNFTFNLTDNILRMKARYFNMTSERTYKIEFDPISFNVNVSDVVWINGTSLIHCMYELDGFSGNVTGKFNLSFDLPVGEYKIEFLCGNFTVSKEFEVKEERYITVGDLYFPNETVKIYSSFEPQIAFIQDPVGNVYQLNFSFEGNEYTAKFELKKDVVLGNYTVVADEFVKHFTVDFYSIDAEFNGSAIIGNVSWHYIMPETIEYTIEPINVSGEVEIVNGSFEIPLSVEGGNYTVILKCGNAVLEIPIKVEERYMKVPSLAFVNEEIVVEINFKPEKAEVVTQNGSFPLNFSERDGLFVASFKVKEVGVYEVMVEDLNGTVYVDDYEIRATFNGSSVKGNVSWHYVPPKFVEYQIDPINLSGKVEIVNGSFVINVPKGARVVKLWCGNAFTSIRVERVSDFRMINVTVGGEIYPINVTIDKGRFEELEFDGENVILNITGIEIGGIVNVTVKLPFEIPEGMHIYYWKEINGSFKPVEYVMSQDRKEITFRLKDGEIDEDNEKNGVIVDPLIFYIPRFRVEKELKGNSGILHVYDLNGKKLYDVKVEVRGGKLIYLAFVDSADLPNPPAKFPFQLLKFRIEGRNATVRITYPELGDGLAFYKFNPKNLSWYKFNVKWENNSVILNLTDGGPGDDDGVRNGIIEDDGGVGWADHNVSEKLINGISLSVKGANISEARFVEPPEGPWRGRGNLTGLLLTLDGEPGFSAKVRLSGVAGILAVTGPGGTPLRVRPGENQTLNLVDGGPADPDGQRDGRVSVTIVAELLGGTRMGISGKGVPEKAPKKHRKQALVKVLAEFEAKGEDGTWLVRWLDVRRPGYYRLQIEGGHVRVHWRGADFEVSGKEFRFDSMGRAIVEALLDGTPAAPPARQTLIAPGKILVELINKSEGEWRRVSVNLPPGAVVEEVLALGNETRKVELWYQRGSELVFYDDPNRYYYVLYGVPEWWDPDGPNSGYDWHYRVPITVPAGDQYQMVVAEVNFTDLLARLNVSGTFDNNSVRVVDPSGNLVPKQEYIPTGPGVGIVKFLLPTDLPTQETFYVYFDILENGAKPRYNTLNTGVDAGNLSHWMWGKSPSGIASIIEASPRGPYTVNAGGSKGSPSSITDDGTPAVGDYSLVLGYRVNETEDYTSGGEDTWAAYEITVPSSGGNLTFWYRVESWDSANFDYLIVTIRDTSNNTLDTVLGPYNPNPGYSYGTFADSGWLSTSYNLTPYAGQTIRVYFTVHTYRDDLYKTWAYVDDLTWCNVTATVQADMVEGFGVNLTEPSGVRTWGPVKVVARVDAAPTGGIWARLYDPSGALVASSPLYDDGTHGDAVAGDGVFTNDNVYTISPGDPLGEWRVVVLANDSSASTYSPSYNGLIHIPGRPYEVNYTDFFNVGEVTFEVRANLTGVVYEDVWPLATGFATEDLPISGARVGLFLDDGDGTFDPINDILVNVTQTDSAGQYSFLAKNDTYWVVVDSKTLTSPRGLNPGHSWNETWAEGTYVVSWNGSAHTGSPDFGGRNPEVSDNCSLEVIFHDGFETWAGWTDYGSGTVSQSNEQAYEGSYSLKKDSNNGPNGGYKLLSQTVGRGVILQGYTYRPSSWSGDAIDSIGLEDSSFNGYTFAVDHKNNLIYIDRRDSGGATNISTQVKFDPPEDEWYFWKLIFFENNTIVFQVYNLSGNLLAEVRATDATYSSFDRVVVHGGYEYYVDELTLWRPGTRCEHVAKVFVPNYTNQSIDFGFSFDVVVNTKDSDDDPSSPRYCQGCLRQFIINANAINGSDRSYFVMMVNPNSNDTNGSWWTITVNQSLGSLPAITDQTELNGTVFYPNMTVRDENPGYVLYNYSTQNLESYSTQETIPVGVGSDAIPFSGDEAELKAVPKPEIEIYGNGIVGSVLNITANNSILSDLSIFGAETVFPNWWDYGFGVRVGEAEKSYGKNTVIKNVFVGLRANATDPKDSGLSRNNIGIAIYSNNTTVMDSIIAFNNETGIFFWGDYVDSGKVRGVQAYRNGLMLSFGDGIAMEGYMTSGYDQRASNVTIENCLAAKNAAFGIDSWFGKSGLVVRNCTVENNSIGNETGDVKEFGGIRVLANNSKVEYNLIRNNHGPGVVIGRTELYPTYGITVTRNSIFNNTRLGIDIDLHLNGDESFSGDNVTLNDGKLDPSQPNYGVDYPVITYAELLDDTLYVEGFIGDEIVGGSSNFANAIVDVYLVKNSTGGDDLFGNNVLSDGSVSSKYYGEGWIYLGSLTADSNGNFSGTLDVTGRGVEWYSYITATTTLNGNTSEFGPDYLLVKFINISAGITAFWQKDHLNVTINVKAYRDMKNVTVYWIKPDNFTVNGISGDYDENGSSGNYYWWRFNELKEGEVRTIHLNVTPENDFRLLDIYNIGVDPR